jgi:hypothetical protein
MTKRDKIIEILQQYVDFSMYSAEKNILNAIADAILAIPIEVPTDGEIEKASSKLKYEGFVHELHELKEKYLIFTKWGFSKGAKWAINEIIKRNK